MSLNGTIALLAVLAFLNYRSRHSVVYPPFIFCGVWLIDLLVYRIQPVQIDQLHAITLNVVSGGALLFSAGGAAAFAVPALLLRTRVTVSGPPKGTGRRLKNLLILALALGVCMQFRYLASLASSAGGLGLGFIAAARNAMVEDINQTGTTMRLFSYVTTWAVFCAILFQVERRDRKFWIMVGVAFASCIASTGRGQILLLLSSLSCVYILQTKQENFRAAFRFARWPLVAFGILFVALMFTNKNTENLQVSAVTYVLQSLAGYLCGSVAALDLVLRHPSSFVQGATLPETLRSFFTLAAALRLISYTPPPLFNKYVFVPFPINTFTVYKPFFVDFGLFSSVGAMAIIGFLHTLLYRKARTGSQLGLYMFALTMYPVLLVFFVDAYTSLSLYGHAFLFGILYLTLRSIPAHLFRYSTSELGTTRRPEICE